LVSLGKVSIAVKTFGVCDFSRLAVTDWRLWFLALKTATQLFQARLLPQIALDAKDARLSSDALRVAHFQPRLNPNFCFITDKTFATTD